jgi:hypothetical protein
MQQESAIELIAYQLYSHPLMEKFRIEPASKFRQWMEDTPNRFAYRCLPLVIANQIGWVVTCPTTFEVGWTGEVGLDALIFRFEDKENAETWKHWISSHFGSGILTFSLPFIFRTSKGYGLTVRGPTNHFKPGVAALDGFIETDWHDFTFTMNWKLVDPKRMVRFEAGEPIAMIAPCSIALLEGVDVALRPIEAEPQLKADFEKKAASRSNFLVVNQKSNDWQRDYFQGRKADRSVTPVHYSKVNLKEFSPSSNSPSALDVSEESEA